MRVVVQDQPFDIGAETTIFAAEHKKMGAIVTFTGIVRDIPDDPLQLMEIEHYPGMTEAALREIAQNAIERWTLGGVLIIHRYGRLAPGEVIMMIATASKHRKNAFEAAEYLMDYLKSRAPFWKREITKTGESWVASKAEDEDALTRW
jgi:molybdopterin synthase catalytic subunit